MEIFLVVSLFLTNFRRYWQTKENIELLTYRRLIEFGQIFAREHNVQISDIFYRRNIYFCPELVFGKWMSRPYRSLNVFIFYS